MVTSLRRHLAGAFEGEEGALGHVGVARPRSPWWSRGTRRPSSRRSSAGDAPADVVDIEGWLFKVKARDGRAIRLPKKRWVVLAGSTLTWFEDAKGEAEANSQALLGAVCTIPMKSSNYAMTPAMKAFASLQMRQVQCSTGPNGEVNHEMVFAASTSGDRAQWANLQIHQRRAKSGAPTRGRMYKEGGPSR